ncbi:MAG: metallophosphoesterase [Rhodocyclaceae bacterium]|nr:metallophosphoesterase [Rhodocyclaceae bacterium]
MKILVLSDLHLEFKAPQPANVCAQCGVRFGLGKCGFATWHSGLCDVCQSQTHVTSPDHFGALGNDWTLNLPDPSMYDAVVLAGDIHSHTHTIPWASKTFPDKDIIYVSGNHEFYGSHLHGCPRT